MTKDDPADDRGYMVRAIEEAEQCVSEPGKNSPLVGAVVVKGEAFVAAAFRGERKAGDHAEFTLLEKKRPNDDLSGATLYATLEPCTTRNHPKVPCAKRLLERGIAEVVIGMLDPDPRIYGNGLKMLKDAGVRVRFFPEDLRNRLREINVAFLGKYRANPLSEGTANFNYKNNDGIFTIGHDDYMFDTKWTSCGDHSVYLYRDQPNVEAIGIAVHTGDLNEVIDATVYDMSSRYREVKEGEIAVLKNRKGYYALLKVVDVTNVAPQQRHELKFAYRILTDKTTNFGVTENSENNDDPTSSSR